MKKEKVRKSLSKNIRLSTPKEVKEIEEMDEFIEKEEIEQNRQIKKIMWDFDKEVIPYLLHHDAINIIRILNKYLCNEHKLYYD